MTSRAALRLNKANVYHSYHSMQDRDATRAIRRYTPKMKWYDRHKVLDIGCGPGDLTVNYLLPFIPKNGQMLGVDISQSMITYANLKYKDSRLKFKVMDITDPLVGQKYKHSFNSVFSFYCLHWIQDQWITMKNIYDMLKYDGETLLVFLASSPIYDMYEALFTKPKWSSYMHDYKKVVSPYHHSLDPESDIRSLLNDVGFNVEDCYCTATSYTMPSFEIMLKSIEAVNPFLNRIPARLIDAYTADCKYEIQKRNLCVQSENTKEVTVYYKLMTVYATKSHFI